MTFAVGLAVFVVLAALARVIVWTPIALRSTRIDAPVARLAPELEGYTIAVLSDLVNGVMLAARQVTTTLRPRVLEEFGLAAALEWHLEKAQKQTGMVCNFSVDRDRIEVEPFVAAQIFRIAEGVVELRAQAGCKSLHVRAFTQEDAIAFVFEDSGKDRQLTPEVSARVRLLGGEIEISNEDRSIVIAVPTKFAGLA